MGKSAKKRKRQRLMEDTAGASGGPVAVPAVQAGRAGRASKPVRAELGQAPVGAPLTEDPLGGLPPGDVAATVRTLQFLARRPDVFRAKPLKTLRAALHSLTASKAMEAAGKSLVGRASDAFRDGRWEDALGALRALRAQGQAPKLGALCRWVRDADAASGLDDPLVCAVMDAALRVAAPVGPEGEGAGEGEGVRGGVVRCEPWGGGAAASMPLAAAIDIDNPVPLRTDEEFRSGFRVVQHLAAADRQPPNKHDLRIHASEPGTAALAPSCAVSRVDMPGVPGAFMLKHLLTPGECERLLAAATAVGFDPDEPATGSASVLAHACVWLADAPLNDALFERCRALLPPVLGGGDVVGLNARWRLYRYVPGAVYRPHIDGAWPGSGLSPEGEYLYDAYGDRWSRLTFLIYLNSQGDGPGGFQGGATTYYVPGPLEGWLHAYPTLPTVGCAMVFPHGETAGSLLHEGSAVTEGAKYVIRTEVLYRKQHTAPEAEAAL